MTELRRYARERLHMHSYLRLTDGVKKVGLGTAIYTNFTLDNEKNEENSSESWRSLVSKTVSTFSVASKMTELWRYARKKASHAQLTRTGDLAEL